jgi:PAS domain S-box-containing protein
MQGGYAVGVLMMPGDQQFGAERVFRLLVEGVVDYAIFMLDVSGNVVSWNSGAERIKGYRAAEIIGRHFSIFYRPEDRDTGQPAKSLEAARRDGSFSAEGQRVRKDGTLFYASVVIDAIYEHGALIGFAKITRDITERKTAELALNNSENHFKLLVSGVTDYALYMLDPKGIITSWNAGGQQIKGYSPDEIVGQHFSRFYTEIDRKNGKPTRALAEAAQTGRYEEEGLRTRKDGSLFWASVVIDRINTPDGELLGFAKITRDITERRESQARLEKVQRQLAESQKLDALGQLTGGVAHDFNNLLMIVGGGIATLRRVVKGDERALRSIDAIESAVKRGSSLTNQLLSFARRQRVDPKPVNLAKRLNGMIGILATGLGRGINLSLDVAPDVWPIAVDIGEFETALVNLVVNARDAMDGAGTVTISATNVPATGDGLRGDHVALTVSDTGVGIPDDVLARIFEPFFTTKAVGKGTGLGLSQVHGFAHQAGGSVDVRSQLGEGTTVTISVPRAQEAPVTPEGIFRTGLGTVLLVDDNPDVAEVSADLLEQLGYAVRLASSASEALHEIEAGGIDMVVSDIVMPGDMDGIKLAEAIRLERPSIPILLSTGYSEAALKAASGFPILKKPYDIGALSRAIARLGTPTSPNRV